MAPWHEVRLVVFLLLDELVHEDGDDELHEDEVGAADEDHEVDVGEQPLATGARAGIGIPPRCALEEALLLELFGLLHRQAAWQRQPGQLDPLLGLRRLPRPRPPRLP
eukprot:1640577-Rhodomonas_salina.2